MKTGKIFFLLFAIILLIFSTGDLYGQCPMCRMAAESNLAHGGSVGKGLNKGILYMLSVPYILVMTGGYIWWRNNKMVQEEEKKNKEGIDL